MPQPFPLAQWFDVTKRVSRSDRQDVEDQMGLYAYRDNAPESELNAAVQSLRLAVKQHNTKFPLNK